MFSGLSARSQVCDAASPSWSSWSSPFTSNLQSPLCPSNASTADDYDDIESSRYSRKRMLSLDGEPIEQPTSVGVMRSSLRLFMKGMTAILLVGLLFAGFSLWVSPEHTADKFRDLTEPTVHKFQHKLPALAKKLGLPVGKMHNLKVFDRDVKVYDPFGVSGHKDGLPAIIALHGSEDYPMPFLKNTRLVELSDRLARHSDTPEDNFLVVAPEMEDVGGDLWGYENDAEYFQAIADMLVAKYGVNRTEVYVCGHSSGGTMTLYLENEMPDVFRAAAVVEAGTIPNETRYRSDSVGAPTMLIVNHNDNVLAQYGGEQLYQSTIDWLRRNDWTKSPASFVEHIDSVDRSQIKLADRLMWGAAGDAAPTTVISWKSPQPTHAWSNDMHVPGSFDASEQIWSFFRSTRVYHRANRTFDVTKHH